MKHNHYSRKKTEELQQRITRRRRRRIGIAAQSHGRFMEGEIMYFLKTKRERERERERERVEKTCRTPLLLQQKCSVCMCSKKTENM
jgi:hypothetical protein